MTLKECLYEHKATRTCTLCPVSLSVDQYGFNNHFVSNLFDISVGRLFPSFWINWAEDKAAVCALFQNNLTAQHLTVSVFIELFFAGNVHHFMALMESANTSKWDPSAYIY